MTTRTHSKSVVFGQPFLLKGIDRVLPPGAYRVVTDEELIEGISFPVYRRVSTMIFVPLLAVLISHLHKKLMSPAVGQPRGRYQPKTESRAVSCRSCQGC